MYLKYYVIHEWFYNEAIIFILHHYNFPSFSAHDDVFIMSSICAAIMFKEISFKNGLRLHGYNSSFMQDHDTTIFMASSV